MKPEIIKDLEHIAELLDYEKLDLAIAIVASDSNYEDIKAILNVMTKEKQREIMNN